MTDRRPGLGEQDAGGRGMRVELLLTAFSVRFPAISFNRAVSCLASVPKCVLTSASRVWLAGPSFRV